MKRNGKRSYLKLRAFLLEKWENTPLATPAEKPQERNGEQQ
jgi:hypothetical protein